MSNLKDLSAIMQMLTGKSIKAIAEDVVSGKPQEQVMLEVSEHIRRENEKSDVFKNACEELLRGPAGEETEP